MMSDIITGTVILIILYVIAYLAEKYPIRAAKIRNDKRIADCIRARDEYREERGWESHEEMTDRILNNINENENG